MRPCASTLESELTDEERKFLCGLIRSSSFFGLHLEIGTAAGGTLAAMMGCFENQSRPGFVVVDRMTYFPNQLEIVRENLERHHLDATQVDFRVSTSNEAFRKAVDGEDRFDFMLIDASHKILAVMADLRWTRLLSVGGLCCLHDYNAKFPGVKLSVDRFLSRHSNYSVAAQAGTLLAIRKDRDSESREVTPSDRIYSLLCHLPLQVQRKYRQWRPARAS